ncbi:MAG TPA: TonB-dependent receptor [Microscillaceae bacterium]|nr:TonB-dependent receptor [Microscillaceae bacterium]
MKYPILFLFWAFGFYNQAYSQTIIDSAQNLRLTVMEDMLNLKVKGLKKEQIYSASKMLEDALATPVSSAFISQEMIKQSGVVNIPEALRLIPGLLVTQTTHGNYEVYIRGKQTPFAKHLQDAHNKQLLVVIDHVPLFDYLYAGVVWEALPVELHDIERIEIIRTPSVVFWGSTAIGGVIHIFTKKVQNDNIDLQINAQVGSAIYTPQQDDNTPFSTYRASLGIRASDKLNLRLSGNYLFLNRFQSEYYLLNEQRFVTNDSLLFFKQNAFETNINTTLGQKRIGGNFTMFYQPFSKTLITSRFSIQNAHSQVIQSDDTLALTQRKLANHGFNLNIYNRGFHLNTAYRLGKQNYALGYDGNSFTHKQLQLSLNKSLHLEFIDVLTGIGLLQSKYRQVNQSDSIQAFTNYHIFMKSEIYPISPLRIVVSGRGEVFEQIKQPFWSFQINTSFKFREHLIRGSYVYNEAPPLLRLNRLQIRHDLYPQFSPNKTQTIEIGWSTKIASRIRSTLEVFYYNRMYIHHLFDRFLLQTSPDLPPRNQMFKSVQIGSTAQISIWFSKVQLGGFVTLQRSGSSFNKLGRESFKNTPSFFGGFHCNYIGFLQRLSININGYFYNSYISNDVYQRLTIANKILINTKLIYKIWQENTLFANLRNILNQTVQESAYADISPIAFMFGANITF